MENINLTDIHVCVKTLCEKNYVVAWTENWNNRKSFKIKDDWISFANDWKSSISVFSKCVILIELYLLINRSKNVYLYFSFICRHIMKFAYKFLWISYFKIVIMFKLYRSKDKSIMFTRFNCWRNLLKLSCWYLEL